jgi:alpha-galactosidase
VDGIEEPYWVHGVLAADRSEALLAYVQLDEAVRDPVPFLVPGLDPQRSYLATEVGPRQPAEHPALPGYRWRGDGLQLSGAVLAEVGLPAPQRWSQSCLLVWLRQQ